MRNNCYCITNYLPVFIRIYRNFNTTTPSEIKNHKKLKTELGGAARTQAPTATNYDVGSATWADLREAPLLSAMEVTPLGHGPS
uniref:Uncharacterized protein n=1 Tax=Cajanus cajan TaxID=3821 RepID=A0A151T1E8_CAJCA|nr:hypothetical protein KK1_023290 [Cajanus cajan]